MGIYDKISLTDDKMNPDDSNLLKSAGLFSTIDDFSGMYRNGRLDVSGTPTTTREIVFFTKPDLNIYSRTTNDLVGELQEYPFWQNLKKNHLGVIKELCYSANSDGNYLSNFLFNRRKPNSYVDVPSLSANMIDNPTNMFGTAYDYRGSSEASNDNFDFNLEFIDNRNLDTYMYFRAYDEYETLKQHGKVAPQQKYIEQKVLSDAIGIYKFIILEDGETILYYAYYTGVTFKSFGRDTFSNPEFNEGISYSIDCKCAFMEDMDPVILDNFNNLTSKYREYHTKSDISLWNFASGCSNNSPVTSAYIKKENGKYKLKWRR